MGPERSAHLWQIPHLQNSPQGYLRHGTLEQNDPIQIPKGTRTSILVSQRCHWHSRRLCNLAQSQNSWTFLPLQAKMADSFWHADPPWHRSDCLQAGFFPPWSHHCRSSSTGLLHVGQSHPGVAWILPVWKTAEQLGLPPPLSPVWLQVLSSLQIAGIARCGPSDHLRWSSTSSSASISVKDVYSELIFTLAPTPAPIFPSTLWKSGCPPRMIYFAWLLFNNRNLTWDNLIKRSWHGPSRCYICESDEESNLHIFFCCRLTLDLWCELARLYSFPHVEFDSVQAAYNWWTSQPAKRRPLLIITVWFIWPWRNHRIFYSIKTPLHTILPCICSLYDYISNST